MKIIYVLLALVSIAHAQQHEQPKQIISSWQEQVLAVTCDPAVIATPLIASCTYNLCPHLPYPYVCMFGAGVSLASTNLCSFKQDEDDVEYPSSQMAVFLATLLKKGTESLLPCMSGINLSKTKQE